MALGADGDIRIVTQFAAAVRVFHGSIEDAILVQQRPRLASDDIAGQGVTNKPVAL